MAVALNSKTYVCWDSVKNTSNASSKGISKRLNVLTADVYKSVLQTQQPFTVINRGFMRKDHQMVTYKQSREWITYYYAKRQVLKDGVSTIPKATVEVDISGPKAIVRLGDHPIRHDFFINTI